ncbi:MAG: hypothetical protein SOI44_09715 [Lactimicrobium sp.]|jgi:hypothetical protein|uniref:hypothetical protein n=1 Tax=Lactimicrobium sp. TaxID=2563780 RepID=UPI002F351233
MTEIAQADKHSLLIHIVLYVLYLMIFFIVCRLNNGYILEQQKAYHFVPVAVFRILSISILLIILFIKVIFAVTRHISSKAAAGGLLFSIALLIIILHNAPADIYPALFC